MKKTMNIKVNVKNAELLLKGHMVGKVFLSSEGLKMLEKAVEEKRF